MNSYESVLLFKPDISKDSLDKALSQVQEIIVKDKGSVEKIDEWGKKRLAYPIEKYKEGFYYLLSFHIDPEAISKLKRVFGLNEAILRALVIRK